MSARPSPQLPRASSHSAPAKSSTSTAASISRPSDASLLVAATEVTRWTNFGLDAPTFHALPPPSPPTVPKATAHPKGGSDIPESTDYPPAVAPAIHTLAAPRVGKSSAPDQARPRLDFLPASP